MSAMAKCGVCGADTPVEEGAPLEGAVCPACRSAQDAARGEPPPQVAEDDGVRVSLQEALFGPSTAPAAAGCMCHGCGAPIHGVSAGKDAYMHSAGLSQFPVSGYQCGACGAVFCASCKMGVLQWSSWGGFESSKCPRCQEAFRPSAMTLDGDPAAIAALLGAGVEAVEDEAPASGRGWAMKLGLLAGLASVALLLAAGFAPAPAGGGVALAVAGLVVGAIGLSLCSGAVVSARAARSAAVSGAAMADAPPVTAEPGAPGAGPG